MERQGRDGKSRPLQPWPLRALRVSSAGGNSFTHPGGRNEAKPVSSQSRQRSRSVPGLALRRLRIGAAAGNPDSRMEALNNDV